VVLAFGQGLVESFSYAPRRQPLTIIYDVHDPIHASFLKCRYRCLTTLRHITLKGGGVHNPFANYPLAEWTTHYGRNQPRYVYVELLWGQRRRYFHNADPSRKVEIAANPNCGHGEKNT
jgi:hypothetical protein